MKNKHLTLLFVCTLFLGVVAKYSPWFKGDIFKTCLICLDANDLQRITIVQAGKSELLLERSDEGWVASQDDFAALTPDSTVTPILEALARIHSLRIIQSKGRDTLQLSPEQAIHVEVLLKNGQKERFDVGKETMENGQPATFVEIDPHEGTYLTDKHLRRVFAKTVNDFRDKTVLNFSPEKLHGIQILVPGGDSLFLQKIDTAQLWLATPLPQVIGEEAVQKWIADLQQLKDLPFATHSDEMHATENLLATVLLETPGEEDPLSLQVFGMTTGGFRNNRAAVPMLRAGKPLFILQSSRNPFNFFALSDTLLLQKICDGPQVVLPAK